MAHFPARRGPESENNSRLQWWKAYLGRDGRSQVENLASGYATLGCNMLKGGETNFQAGNDSATKIKCKVSRQQEEQEQENGERHGALERCIGASALQFCQCTR